ncbi:NYN domain-containing protein, partial [Patescibacteria group bacterium]|nr:NYN domain-containing protein [Patescibacteria group bacterium]
EVEPGNKVLSLDESTGKIVPRPINALLDMGVQPVYKLTTEDGRTIRTTGNHPYLTKDGWKKVVDLKEGEKIAVTDSKISAANLEEDQIDGNSAQNGGQNINDNFSGHNFSSLSDAQININDNNGADNYSDAVGKQNIVGHNLSFPAKRDANLKKSTQEKTDNKEAIASFTPHCLANNGAITPAENQATAPLIKNSEYTPNSSVAFLTNNDSNTRTTIGVKQAKRIPVPTEGLVLGFVHIVSIEYAGEEQVYDIEVEGTHNFVAGHWIKRDSSEVSFGSSDGGERFFGGIVAHNTYISGNLGVGITTPASKLDINGTAWLRGTGTSGLFVDSNGNVGIGLTNPTYKLQVVGNGYFSTNLGVGNTVSTTTLSLSGAFLDSTTGAGSNNQILSSTGTGTTWKDITSLGVGGSGTQNYLSKWMSDGRTLTNAAFYDTGTTVGIGGTAVTTAPQLYIGVGGNVGIGTTSPSALLETAGTAWLRGGTTTTGLFVNSSGNVGVGTTAPTDKLDIAGSVGIGTTYANALPQTNMLYVSGNVGIGTTNPGYKLEVVGTARIRGSTTASGLIVNSSGNVGIGYTGTYYETFNLGDNLALYPTADSDTVDINVRSSAGPSTKTAYLDFTQAGSWGANARLWVGRQSGGGGAQYTFLSKVVDDPTSYPNQNTHFAINSTDYFTNAVVYIGMGNTATNTRTSLYTENGAIFAANKGNVGIGKTNPAYKLDVVGNGYFSTNLGVGSTATTNTLRITGALQDLNGSAGSNNQILSSTGTGTTWMDITSIGVGGSGTINYLPKWSAATTLTNAAFYDTGTTVGIGGTAVTTAPQLFITAGGNVGVGTTGPSRALEIGGSGKLRLPETNDATNPTLQFGSDGDTGFYDSGNDTVNFAAEGAKVFDMRSIGIVIATNNGAYIVKESPSLTNPVFSFYQDDNTGIGRADADILSLIAGGTNVLNVTNGNVGIGTTGPSQKLHVEGECVAEDSLVPVVREITNYSNCSNCSKQNSNDQTPNKEKLETGNSETGNSLDQLEIKSIRNLNYVQIKDIKTGDYVLSLNEETQSFEWQKVEKTLDKGEQEVYELITESGKKIETTGNHPYLVRRQNDLVKSTAGNFNNQTPGNDRQNNTNNNQPIHSLTFLSNQDVNKNNNNSCQNRTPSSSRDQIHYLPPLAKLNEKVIKNPVQDTATNPGLTISERVTPDVQGAITPAASQATPKFKQNSANSFRWSLESSSINLNLTQGQNSVNQSTNGQWIKVIYLEKGDEIYTLDGFELIKSIEKTGVKHVYDLQIANTHNFVANGIVAHNTYISGNLGVGSTSPASKLDVAGTAWLRGTGTSGLFVDGNGNVGIGKTNPGYKLEIAGDGYFSTNLGIGSTATTNTLRITGALQDLNGSAGSNNQILSSTGTGTTWMDITSIGVGGSGTINYLPKWSASTTLTNAQLFDNSTFVGIGGTAANTNPVLYVGAGGNVGIGTTGPSGILHVVGECVAWDSIIPIRRKKKKKKGDDDEDEDDPSASSGQGFDYLDLMIKDVQPDDEVMSLDENSGQFAWQKVQKTMDKGYQTVFELKTESGKVIETTGNHPYFVKTKKTAKPKVGVFFDNSNLYFAGRQAGWTVDINRLYKLLDQAYDLQFFHLHLAIPAADDHNYKGTQKFIGNLNKNIVLKTKPLKYIRSGNAIVRKGDVDIELSLDVVRNVDKVDLVLIVSGDSDYKELSQYIIKDSQKQIAFVGYEDNMAWELRQMRHIYLNRNGIRQLVEKGHKKAPSLRLGVTKLPVIYQDKASMSSQNGKWQQASSIKAGDIVATKEGWEKVASVKKLGQKQVYDLQIANTHNFV